MWRWRDPLITAYCIWSAIQSHSQNGVPFNLNLRNHSLLPLITAYCIWSAISIWSAIQSHSEIVIEWHSKLRISILNLIGLFSTGRGQRVPLDSRVPLVYLIGLFSTGPFGQFSKRIRWSFQFWDWGNDTPNAIGWTVKRSLVPLFKGLCSSTPCGFKFSVLHSYLSHFFFPIFFLKDSIYRISVTNALLNWSSSFWVATALLNWFTLLSTASLWLMLY